MTGMSVQALQNTSSALYSDDWYFSARDYKLTKMLVLYCILMPGMSVQALQDTSSVLYSDAWQVSAGIIRH